jgi:hypoxanthine phosphoribosyltransferase
VISQREDVEVLLDEAALAARVGELGRRITEDYRHGDLTALVVLKGSYVFAADLLRRIDLPLAVEFIGLRSYGSRRQTSGVVEITMDVQSPLEGKNILIVEDIVDTGLTLSYLKENLATRNPASVKVACLLRKLDRAEVDVPVEYLGFDIPDRFVVGYGLDEAEKWRNLPFVGVLADEPLKRLF